MSTTTTRRSSSRCRKPVYPEYPDGRHASDPLLWLTHWLRDLAQAAAAYTARHSGAAKRDSALDDALWLAYVTARDDAKKMIGFLTQSGGLLFAWEGTTALTTEGGAT